MSILSKIIVAAVCLTLCLDASGLLWDSCSSDADCGQKLKCSNQFRCGGDGTSGAHCYGTHDKSCDTGLSCDAKTYSCRAKGTGTAGQGCNGGSDDPCGTGLYCSYPDNKCSATVGDGQDCSNGGSDACSTGFTCAYNYMKCRAVGTGGVGQRCDGYPVDASCDSGLVCSNMDGKCRNPGGGAIGDPCDDYYNDADCSPGVCDSSTRTCRATGSGAVNDYCGISDFNGNTDASCGSGLACDSSTRKCRTATVNGGAGSVCGAPEDTCSATCVCDTYDTEKCRTKGDGTIGANCNKYGDDDCSGACDIVTGTCRASGTGKIGDKCGGYGAAPGYGDATCIGVCDDNTFTCRAPGDGSENAICGSYSGGTPDASCAYGSKLVFCDTDIHKCRPIGHGANGQVCSRINSNGDEYCANCNGAVCDGPVDPVPDAPVDCKGAASRIYVPVLAIFSVLALLI